jgi:hypothetical protein
MEHRDIKLFLTLSDYGQILYIECNVYARGANVYSIYNVDGIRKYKPRY